MTPNAPASSDGSARPRWLGAIIMLSLALASVLFAASFPVRSRDGTRMWTFARLHHEMYVPLTNDWNRDHPDQPIVLSLLGIQAMEQRLLSSFMSGVPSAELLEVERAMSARAFAGPLESVGFTDITSLVERDGLRERIHPAAFKPWTMQGRIFGIPHDLHPVMLGYRADIVEAAGIDVAQIETWDDFVRVLSPLLLDASGKRRTDRHLLNLWETHDTSFEILTLQAGGGLVDSGGVPMLDHPANARVLAQAIDWIRGSEGIAGDAPYFNASGNQLLIDGFVIASFVPDWMCNVWRKEMPQLSGKVKLMPLPAWDAGGRRTSVWGGSMLGIARTADHQDRLWEMAKHLYLSRDVATKLYKEGDIVSPVREYWTDPMYDQPDPFFRGQAPGRTYINLADQVPDRFNSPFAQLANVRMQAAASQLSAYAIKSGITAREQLLPKAQELLVEAQRDVMQHVRRNRFYSERESVSTSGDLR